MRVRGGGEGEGEEKTWVYEANWEPNLRKHVICTSVLIDHVY